MDGRDFGDGLKVLAYVMLALGVVIGLVVGTCFGTIIYLVR